MSDNQWLENKIHYIGSLKSPSVQHQLLLHLAQKQEKTKDDERKLAALVRAEKAAERAAKAKADAMRVINAEKKTDRKARNRELFQSAGLLILAGLVDSKTGKPTRDKAELLGALVALEASNDEAKRQAWKAKGEAVLNAKKKN